jgi:transglutaminase-like putative cysteine protease
MIYRITHDTRYKYSQPIFLEPLLIRQRPRSDGSQQLLDYRCRITPEPAGSSEYLDPEGNAVQQAWFEGLTDELAIQTEMEVETLRENPYDFYLEPEGESLPLGYPGEHAGLLEPYYRSDACAPSVLALAEEIATETDDRTIPFLMTLNQRINESIRYMIREQGEAQPAEETLKKGEGSCRDLAVLFIEACRSCGIAARFVSGYEEGAPEQEDQQLHAWAEVYLPGGGWRGFDPTLGLAVADRHIVLAAARIPVHAAPVSGTYRGTEATSRLDAQIEIVRSLKSEV